MAAAAAPVDVAQLLSVQQGTIVSRSKPIFIVNQNVRRDCAIQIPNNGNNHLTRSIGAVRSGLPPSIADRMQTVLDLLLARECKARTPLCNRTQCEGSLMAAPRNFERGLLFLIEKPA